MKKKHLTLDQHQKIGEWLNSKTRIIIACDIPNSYGKTKTVSKNARRIVALINDLKNEMEHYAHLDGHGEHAQDIYYPFPLPCGKTE